MEKLEELSLIHNQISVLPDEVRVTALLSSGNFLPELSLSLSLSILPSLSLSLSHYFLTGSTDDEFRETTS